MRITKLLILSAFVLVCTNATATIVDGVRQKPEAQRTGFTTDVEAYLYNVGAGLFFTEGNSWGTQASVGETGLLVKFTSAGTNGVYLLNDYSIVKGGWKLAFFDNEDQMFVDRNNQPDYYWEVEENSDGTFRLFASSKNTYVTAGPNGGYNGFYVGLNVAENASNTALSPLLLPDDGHYIDWVLITKDALDAVKDDIEIYNKAQELKTWIDKIKAQNGDASSLETIYLNEASTMTELEAAIASAQPIYIQALINNAPDKENVDVTTALANPDFEYGLKRTTDPKGYGGDYGVAEGWVVDRNDGGNVTPGPLGNEYDGKMVEAIGRTNHCFEAWHCHDFDVYQEAVGLPVGVYEVEVQGYMRCEAPGYTRGDLTGLPNMPIYLYLNKATSQFPDVYSEKRNGWDFVTVEDWTKETINGYDYPNSMGGAAQCFAHGMYKKNAYGLIATDKDVLRIGVKGKTDKDAWVIWDNFKLTYRGFKADVVKPVLDGAVEEVKVYEGLVMGKTEYAALKKALTDAATAIENNDGEAMFKALTDLYAVKDDARISKDLFDEAGVNDLVQSLTEAIAATTDKKLSKTTLQNAQALLAAIKGNTKYEGTEINQLKSDVSSQIDQLNTSVSLYASLNEAIEALNTNAGKKAMQTLIDEATALVATATAAYNEGNVEDSKVEEMISEVSAKNTQLSASVTLYANFAAAIGRLQAAIDEVSGETKHVSKNTLAIANAQLKNAQKVYGEGSIADDEIEKRVENIDNIITNLTKSFELYKQLSAAIDDYKAAVEAVKNEKMSATVRTAANELLATTNTDYEEGNYTDEQIAGQLNALTTMTTKLNSSVAQYKELATAIASLKAVEGKKTSKDVADEYAQLLASTNSGYENGTIADEDVEGIVAQADDMVKKVNASAELYTKFAAAIERLQAAIDEVSGETEHVSKNMLAIANAQLKSAKKGYEEGTIADDNIDTRINNIDNIITNLTKSVNLYKEFAAAIADMKTAIDGVEGKKLAQATVDKANLVYSEASTAYEEGSIADDDVQGQIAVLNNMITTLNASVALYERLAAAVTALEETLAWANKASAVAQTPVKQETLDAAATLLAQGKAGYENGTIEDEKMEATLAEMNTMKATLTEAVELAQTTVTVGEAGFATFVSEKAISFKGSDVKAYTVKYNETTGMAKLLDVSEIPANTPVVVEAQQGVYKLQEAGSADKPEVNDLIVVKENGTYGTLFVLANKSNGVGFYRWAGNSLPVNKVALDIPATAREFVGFDFETTSIDNASMTNAPEGTVYNMQGHKLDKIRKGGLYIVNGKKVVVK